MSHISAIHCFRHANIAHICAHIGSTHCATSRGGRSTLAVAEPSGGDGSIQTCRRGGQGIWSGRVAATCGGERPDRPTHTPSTSLSGLETGMPPEVWRVFQDSLQQQDGATPQNAITARDSRAVSHRGAAPIAPPRDLVAFLTAIHGPQKGRVASQVDTCDISAVDTTNIQSWTRDRRATYHMIVVGSQFLTTTDELCATSRSHIQLDGSRNVVTWTLPTGPPETQATTVDVSLWCRCPIMGQRLCPYHNMVELLNLTDSKGETDRPFVHMTPPTSSRTSPTCWRVPGPQSSQSRRRHLQVVSAPQAHVS